MDQAEPFQCSTRVRVRVGVVAGCRELQLICRATPGGQLPADLAAAPDPITPRNNPGPSSARK
ncbi:MAG TPA: hypothetical protein VIV12_01390 [Streptosporangiaceae bacterium]